MHSTVLQAGKDRIGTFVAECFRSLTKFCGASRVNRPPFNQNIPLVVVLVTICVIIAIASAYYASRSVHEILRVETSRTAENAVQLLVKQLPDLEGIANGKAPTPGELKVIESFTHIGQVFLFKVFDREGRFRLVSGKQKNSAGEKSSLATHNALAASAIETGQVYIEVKSGTGKTDRPLHYSEAYVPVIKAGRTTAVVEVYIDQSSRYADYMNRARDSTLFFSLLAALAFGTPALGFYLQSQQVSRASQRLRLITEQDQLTGLPNRLLFHTTLRQAIIATGEGIKFGLLCLDLDHFKSVNDTFGHDVGDKLLLEVAQRIQGAIRPVDTAARLGGDEFAIIQTNIKTPEDCETVAARLVSVLAEPFFIDGHHINIGLSVGIALAPSDGEDAETVFKAADIALYKAKSEGRGRFRFFETGMDKALQERREMENALRSAIQAEEFELHYQPQVNVDGGAIVGYEALLRWRHPKLGLIPPADFIPLAEETTIIKEIGRWVLKRACSDAVSWREPTSVAVNVSAVQISSPTIVADVERALKDSGLAPIRLEIEITESALLGNIQSAIRTLLELKELGVRISMDDFGTGYSSLSYLHQFPIDKVKIDRSFVSRIEDDADARAIIRAVVSLSRSLGKQTTAEGVESYKQAELLRHEGCTQMQGYLIGKPMPEVEVQKFEEQWCPRGPLRNQD